METELHKLKLLRSFNLRTDPFKLQSGSFKLTNSPSIIRDHDPDIDSHEYTSLKDIILNSPPLHASSYEGGSNAAFNSSSISIRNVLVKHAASAYVQSAILTNRNQNCFDDIWEKIKNQVTCHTCLHACVTKPLRGCFRVIFRFLDCMVNGIKRVWNRRVTIR